MAGFTCDLSIFRRVTIERPQATTWAPDALRPPAAAPVEAPAGPSAEELEAAEALRREEELEAAYARGYEAGMDEARRREAERVRAALALLEEAAARVAQSDTERAAAAHDDLCALAVAVASHVIGREARTDAQVVTELVRRALAEFPLEQALRVRIHPQDLALLAASGVAGEAAPVAPGRELTWVPDPELVPGGVIVEGRERILDGRVDLALERLYRTLAHG